MTILRFLSPDICRRCGASMNESMRQFQRLSRKLSKIANDGGQQR